MPMTYDEAWALAQRLRNNLKLQNQISFADMPYRAPDIDYYPDKGSFMDPEADAIHIGVHGLVDYFGVESEEAFKAASDYMQGHEEQHRRSTAARPYGLGIKRGIELVVEYIASQVDPTKRFRKDKDYAYFCSVTLPDHGIYLSLAQVQSIVAGIFNAVEDGRIERIRSNRFPGFENLRTMHRSIVWDSSKEVYPPYEKIKDDASEKLRIMINQILTLATCQVYEKGFVMAYAGTALIDEVQALMPHIAGAYTSGSTRQMAEHAVRIVEKLAPYIYEAAKISEDELEMLFQKLTAMIIKVTLESGNESAPLEEKDEDTDEGSANTAFPASDLAMDQETLEKLKEETRNKEGGIRAKDESSEEPEPSDTPSGQGSESAEETEELSTSKAAQDMPSEQQDAWDATQTSEGEELNQPDTKNTKKGPEEATGIDEAAIKAAAKEAAGAALENARSDLEDINVTRAHEAKERRSQTPDKDDPITAADVKDLLPEGLPFLETKREYKLTENLPPVIRERGRTLKRNNDKYFRSISTPNRSYLDSGSIDPHRIYGLAIGDTQVFRKKGQDRKFDGCAYVLIDHSGSMEGQKHVAACQAAAVIEEGFRGIMPMKIVSFNWRGGVVHEVVKGWEEQQQKNCCWNFCLNSYPNGGNEDGHDIAVATNELLKRPESKKILIVLSDGAPGNEGLVRAAVKKARRYGIKVASIYFEEGEPDAETFKQMYEKDLVICEPSQIVNHLCKIMQRFSRS